MLGLVLGRVSRQMAVGALIGVAAALLLARALRSLLYEVEGVDPVTVAGALAFLTLIGLAAAFMPARRASRVDPVEALRWE